MQYLWCVFQSGNESWVKSWVTSRFPQLKSSYSRPGFVSFKNEGIALPPHFRFSTPLIHRTVISYGKFDSAQLASFKLPEGVRSAQVWRLAPDADSDEISKKPETKAVAEVSSIPSNLSDVTTELKKRGLRVNAVAEPEEQVAQLLEVIPQEWWWGIHQFDLGESRYPGARPTASLPEEAPSRAYLKLKEIWMEAEQDLRPGQRVLEVGCAPGGMSLALLERGVEVVGVDAGEMAVQILEHPRFRHLKRSINRVRPSEVGPRIDWLVMDMHAQPRVTIPIFLDLWRYFETSLRGGVLVLKLNSKSEMDELEDYVGMLKDARLGKLICRQLPSNRKEITVGINATP